MSESKFKLPNRQTPLENAGLPTDFIAFLQEKLGRPPSCENVFGMVLGSPQFAQALFDKFSLNFKEVEQALRQAIPPRVVEELEAIQAEKASRPKRKYGAIKRE